MSAHVFICTMFWCYAIGVVLEFFSRKTNMFTLVLDLLLGAWALVLTGWLS